LTMGAVEVVRIVKDGLSEGGSMTVIASVTDDPGNVVYVWYINGESVGTGEAITLGSNLDIGVYGLDVTAFTADGKRAGSTSHMFYVIEGVPGNIIAATAGTLQSFIIKDDGTLWAIGYNSEGFLGDRSTIDRHLPVHIMDNVISVSSNGHGLAIKSDGSLWTWGWNAWGQLGNGIITDQLIPINIQIP